MLLSSRNFVTKSFHAFLGLQQQKDTHHGFINSKSVNDLEDVIRKNIVTNLTENLRSSQLFMVNNETENARNKVFKFAIKSLNATKVNVKILLFF